MAQLRIDKYLADAGFGSRTQVKQILKKNRVTVNGEIVKTSDYKIDHLVDIVSVDGSTIRYSQFEYYMLNKPAGVVSAVTDKRDKTVIELIDTPKRRDLFPVGRLDKDTEGLLLITNDGQLSNDLLSPKKHVEKTYFARVVGEVTEKEVLLFQEGVDIGEPELTKPGMLEIKQIIKDNISVNEIEHILEKKEVYISDVMLTITEGKFHQVKRMFEAVEMEVIYLKRLRMGTLVLDDTLKLGEYRRLNDDEINTLKDINMLNQTIKQSETN